MTDELKRRQELVADAIKKVSRLGLEQWATREQLFDKSALAADVEWQEKVLKRFAAEHMLDKGIRRVDKKPIYRVSQVNRFKALAFFTGVLAELSVLDAILKPAVPTPVPPPPVSMIAPRVPTIRSIPPPPPPSSEAEPITGVRKTPYPGKTPSRVMLEVSGALYEKLQERANEKGLTVKAYLVDLLKRDGVLFD